MTPYIIYSTPRSGSAWLANFLSYDGSFCYHDPLENTDPADLGVLLSTPGYDVVGCVDTGAALFRGSLSRLGLRQFALVRDAEDVSESLLNIGLPDVSNIEMIESIDVDVVFRYEGMFTLAALAPIWAVVTGLPFDPVRAAQLLKMNVQRDFASYGADVPRFVSLIEAEVKSCLG